MALHGCLLFRKDLVSPLALVVDSLESRHSPEFVPFRSEFSFVTCAEGAC